LISAPERPPAEPVRLLATPHQFLRKGMPWPARFQTALLRAREAFPKRRAHRQKTKLNKRHKS
jgi:hypothetical protein